MRRTLSCTLALSFLTAFLVAGPTRAQESTTRGFNIGLHATGASLKPEDGDRSNAAGGGLWIGYGFNRTIQLFAQFDGAEFDVRNAEVEGTWTLGHGDLGVRFHFANSLRSWVPYLQAAFTGRVVSVKDGQLNQVLQTEDISLQGGGFTAGGGIMLYFNQTLAVDLQLVWTAGRFTDIKVGSVTVSGQELDAQSSRFNIGVSWWP